LNGRNETTRLFLGPKLGRKAGAGTGDWFAWLVLWLGCGARAWRGYGGVTCPQRL